MPEELEQVVEALGYTDRSIQNHLDELGRLRGLRLSLAARLDELGTPAPPMPTGAPAKRTEGVRAADTWLKELEETGRSPQLPIDPTTQMNMPAAPEENWQPPSIEVRTMPTIVNGEHRYERVLIRAFDIPQFIPVWIWAGPGTQEAHLGYSEDRRQFTGEARCGHYAVLSKWWKADRERMEHEVEVCKPCVFTLAARPQ